MALQTSSEDYLLMTESHEYSGQIVWIMLGLGLVAVGQVFAWAWDNPSLQGVGWVATVIGAMIAVISRAVFSAVLPAATTRD